MRKISITPKSKTYSFLIIGNILLSAILIGISFIPEEDTSNRVIVNTIGYLRIDQNKTFLLKTDNEIGSISFNVVDINGNIVLNGQTKYLGFQWDSYYSIGNFSDLNTDGNYTIEVVVDGKKHVSYDFEISNDVYLDFIDLLYTFFYYQRCGCKVVDNVVPGYVGHEACHLDDATNIDNSESWLNLSGGWHDAGDYNKYHSTTAISLLGLGLSFEMGSNYFNSEDLCDDYPILSDYSYQNDEISDLLEEIIWGANFVSKLVREDGSVIDKVGSNDEVGWYGYSGIPSMETDSINGTLDDRIFNPNNGYMGIKVAASLLKAAEILNQTSQYRIKFPIEINNYYQNGLNALKYYYREPKSTTNWWDFEDLLLADMSLYELSGNTSYFEEANYIGYQMLTNTSIFNFSQPGFGHIGNDFRPAKLFYWLEKNGSSTLITEYGLKMANRMQFYWGPLSQSSSNSKNYFNLLKGYNPNHGDFYFWPSKDGEWNVGHNSYYAVAAWSSILAYNTTGNYEFLDFALRQIDWICGRNPFSLCMIEGVGEKNMPAYHNRASDINGNYRGAPPGCVPNGIIREKHPTNSSEYGRDVPWYDTQIPSIDYIHADYQSNEPWIPHNSYFLLAISALYKYGLSTF